MSEWQGVFSILEIEAFQQELGLSSFLQLRDNCRIDLELSNIASQLKDCIDCINLVSRGKSKLQVLQCEAQNLENQFSRLKMEPEPQNSKEINLVDGTLKAIHWKCHAQLSILEKFRKMFESSKVEHKVVVEKASTVK